MTVPYERIKSRVDCQAVPCLMCDAVTLHAVIDHCHEHGWTRGVLCMSCNNRMARVDADLSRATARELFHRDNCPACRRDGYAGVTRRIGRRTSHARHADGMTTLPVTGGVTSRRTTQSKAPDADRVRIIHALIDRHGAGNVTGAMVGEALGVDRSNGYRALQRVLRAHGTVPDNESEAA